jgi:hypothetical protein
MKKINMLWIAAALFVGTNLSAQQNAERFAQYANDTLKSNDPRFLEMPTTIRTADAVLNKKIAWRNPYPTVENTTITGFDGSKIGKTPEKGIYPRIFTSPDEFKNIKKRLETTQIGRQLTGLAERELSAMRKGEGEVGKFYNALKANDLAYDFGKLSLPEMSNRLAVQGLLAQVFEDKNLSIETGRVAANLLKRMMQQIDTTPSVQGRELMVKEAIFREGRLAKLFDFTATDMSEVDKKAFVDFMAKNTFGKYGDGMQLPPHWRRWNFIGSSIAYPLSILAIEGQKGYDKRIYDRGVELTQDYLTYAFSPEGMSCEGIAYTFNNFSDDLLFMIAVARREQAENPKKRVNLLNHPHFRAIPDWLIAALSPNPNALWYSHGDTGSASNIPWLMMMMMKYFYPTDAKIDYLFAQSLSKDIRQLPDVSAFVFCTDADKTAADYAAKPPVSMPLTYFSPSRGSFIARDKWEKEGIQFQFDARQDMYFQSHDHADRGNFELAAHGRMWVLDGWRSTESKYHSVITIDGRGQGYFATPAEWLDYVDKPEATFGVIDYKYCFDWRWLKSPVADLMLGKTVEPQWETGVYAESAKKMTKYFPNARPERDPLRKVADYFSGNLATNPLIWGEDTWVMRLPNFEVAHAFRTAGLVKGAHSYMLIVDDLKKDNQERLYEWLMPMPLDVEIVSIKQAVDVTQRSGALDIGFNSFENKGTSGEYDLILGDKTMKRNMDETDNVGGEMLNAGRFTPQKGNPQLLVRVLERTAAAVPNLEPNPRLETIEKLKTEDMHQYYLRTMDLGKRLVVPSRSNAPNFKVLLFPYRHGEALPQTLWNADRTVLTVSWRDQKDVFYFSKKGETGRTKVKLERNGVVIFDL